MKREKRLLFVGPCGVYFRSFMQLDLDLLKEGFDVRLVRICYGKRDLKRTLKTHLGLLSGIAWADAVFCWFADYEAFAAIALSQLLSKKTAVVVGGRDVTSIPELGYGLALHSRNHFYRKFALNRATKVLPYSRDAERGALGFLNDTAKVKLIYLGVDSEKFHPLGIKNDTAITVGAVTHSNLKRKGLETFVKSAAYLPDVEFVLIGRFLDTSINYLRSIATTNVRFTGFLAESELILQYQQAKVYVQVSGHEAFGLGLAEAMACECVPVITDKGAISEVVGDTGIYVAYGDPAGTAQGIEQALSSDKGRIGRQRIEKMFAIGKRKEALRTTMTGLLD
jgi:glycosyltransferase involved in cell wall biosynthesis